MAFSSLSEEALPVLLILRLVFPKPEQYCQNFPNSTIFVFFSIRHAYGTHLINHHHCHYEWLRWDGEDERDPQSPSVSFSFATQLVKTTPTSSPLFFLFLFSFFVCLFIVKSNETNQIVLKPLNSVLNICSILHILKFSKSQVCQDVYEKWENWSFRIKYIESCVKYCRSTSAPNLVCRRIPISNLSPPREILSFRGSILVAWHHHHDKCM